MYRVWLNDCGQIGVCRELAMDLFCVVYQVKQDFQARRYVGSNLNFCNFFNLGIPLTL